MKSVITVVAFIALIFTWAVAGALTTAVLAIGLLFLVLVSWMLFGRKSVEGRLHRIKTHAITTSKNDADTCSADKETISEVEVIDRILRSSDKTCPEYASQENQEEWDAGFKIPPEYCAKEKHMQQLVTNVVEDAAARTPTKVLPEQCCAEPVICPMETTWQAAFGGCPTTYIEGPLACEMYQRDPRAWVFDLNQAMQERATQNAAIWDPYKHFQARQKFAQFIMNDVVNQKATHERPIEQLTEASCFAQKVNGVEPGEYSNGIKPEIPPVY